MKYTEKELIAIRRLRNQLKATKLVIDNTVSLLADTPQGFEMRAMSCSIESFLRDTEPLFQSKQQSQTPT